MKPKGAAAAQTNKLDKYAVTMPVPQSAESTSSQSVQGEPSLASIMAAIQTLGTTLETKIDKMSIEMNLVRADLNKTSDKARANEAEIQQLRDSSKKLEQRVNELVHQHRQLALKLEDQEGRARRNNIWVVGVPENMEGPCMDLFLEDLILNHLKPKRVSTVFTIERAHRALVPKPKPGAPPRTIIAKILNYRDRDAILQAARLKGDLHYENATIRFFPDFTLKVQRERRSFDGVKRLLRQQGIKYMMFFPAKLKIVVGGKSHFFATPSEVQDWLERNTTQGPSTGTRQEWRDTRAQSPGSQEGRQNIEGASQRS